MALHPVNLPKSAARLFWVVASQKQLLKALADPALNPRDVTVAWLQNVWSRLDAEWVRKFCLDGQLERLTKIAAATPAARHALYTEFCRQTNVRAVLGTGGDFQDLISLTGFNRALADEVKNFFKSCYALLSHDVNRNWPGYEVPGGGIISNRLYKEDFLKGEPPKVVCPYCDGELGDPELDHYLSKTGFPLLACSPWNLVPICRSCNNITAKGDRPAITMGPPRSTADWLHPFFRPASLQVQIRLTGTPQISIPELYAPNATEQACLDNHTNLIRSLSRRWTHLVAVYFAELVGAVNRRRSRPVDDVVKELLEDHLAVRGKSASSMVRVAVCRAVLDNRQEYIEEFTNPNAPTLV